MKRYRTIRPAVGVSLFPFLAVLICTMGALIVLLVLVVQLAKVNASEDGGEADEFTPLDSQRMEREDYEWRRTLFEQQRQQMKENVDRNRLVLSHLEQHIRDLEQRWNQLREESADLQLRVRGGEQTGQSTRDELETLQEAIREAREELEAAKKRAANRPPVYSIIPYAGPNGTFRRPIYLECTEEGITIQPEGVVITDACFQGPLGSGNPLDAALRAIREYYYRVGRLGTGEPYPLLVVRPTGIETYAIARIAMRHWDDEFGYELIDETMQVKYPDANPELAQLLEKVIADARSRQEILASAMPSRFERKDDVGFVASPTHGGFVPQPGFDGSIGSRTGGFGQGGDSRYIDGRSKRSNSAAAKSIDQQRVGGPTGDGAPQGEEAVSKQSGNAASLAKSRGRNWGLPRATAGATGIIRPIRVACLRDRVVLLPDRGVARAPEVVLVEGSMLDEIDAVVSKIWDQIDAWGIAVAGGYWKPILRVDVAQGAEQRFEELKSLLAGSGLDVQRNSK